MPWCDGTARRRATLGHAAALYWRCVRRSQVQQKLTEIADKTRIRMRLLTLCSTAANKSQIYDKSAINKLEDVTRWLRSARESVIKASVLAARNTRLTSSPVRCVGLASTHSACTTLAIRV